MKAIVFARYGSPDVLELKEIAKPAPNDDEVLVKVHAASLNSWDLDLLQGDFMNRLLFGLLRPKIKTLGADVAGRVEAVGKNVKSFCPGDDVWGDLCEAGWGGLAEYVCAPEKALALKPVNMTFEQAAAMPQAGLLALQGLRDIGEIQRGQSVLINGAGGGVGTYALQIAKDAGAEATAVDRTGKLAMLSSLGADHVIDFTQEDFTVQEKRYDLILDVRTNRSIFDYARALKPHGTYVTVGGTTKRLLQTFLLGAWIDKTRGKHMRVLAYQPNKGLEYLKALSEAGKITSVIDGPFKWMLGPLFGTLNKVNTKGKSSSRWLL